MSKLFVTHRLLLSHTHFDTKILYGFLYLYWGCTGTSGSYDDVWAPSADEGGRLKPLQYYEALTQVHRHLQEETNTQNLVIHEELIDQISSQHTLQDKTEDL